MSAAEIELKIQEHGLTYIPKKLREQYGLRPIVLPNETAAAMYRPDANPVHVIASLRVLIQHLQLRLKRCNH